MSPDTNAELTPWMRQLAATALAERPSFLERLVREEFRVALLMEESDELPYDESYFAHGLTSLGATEVEQRLEATLGRPLDAASLLNNPTINHMLAHLRTQVLADYFPESGPEQVNGGTVAPEGAPQVPRAVVDDLLKSLYASPDSA